MKADMKHIILAVVVLGIIAVIWMMAAKRLMW